MQVEWYIRNACKRRTAIHIEIDALDVGDGNGFGRHGDSRSKVRSIGIGPMVLSWGRIGTNITTERDGFVQCGVIK